MLAEGCPELGAGIAAAMQCELPGLPAFPRTSAKLSLLGLTLSELMAASLRLQLKALRYCRETSPLVLSLAFSWQVKWF